MPIRLCLEPRCPNPSTYRGRCPTHAKQRNTETTSANKHVYNSAKWKHTRERVLHEQPLCATTGCDEIATDVDHIKAIEDGGDPWTRSNLQGLCPSCHGAKTRREMQTR